MGHLRIVMAGCGLAILGGSPATLNGTPLTYSFTEIATCTGSFSSGCTVQATSNGTLITNSGTVMATGSVATYSASSISVPTSLGGMASVSSNTTSSSTPGIMVDALEQFVDNITIDDPGYDGQTGYLTISFTLDGTNTATGVDSGAQYGGTGVPYACVKVGIGDPILPFGCTGFDQASLNQRFTTGAFAFTFGQAFPLWFQLESIAGTGFGGSIAIGMGTSEANFFQTAAIDGFGLYDQNMNLLGSTPNIDSASGASYQDLNTPEPATFWLSMMSAVGIALIETVRRRRVRTL